ncbi:beta-galactosidase [Uliginosibacterium gangwonense]|uniref:beta-galactosidase n=1 Tax=Uliginosibacterium gangwonense TaxID=392736 RepID=UPI000379188E|nr:beta-galactosidase [Uliginosibacterium gangwonense]
MKLGVCYYPEQWDRSMWLKDAQDMVRLGVKVVRIAEFAWSRMEPQPGQYDWAWLDDAVGILADQGLEIVLGTPTAAPPRWLLQAHPDMLARDAQGRERGFGSRRHYCFSSESYREACRVIVTEMARRYGQHPAVIAWQTDNEYGCHDTVISYSDSALRRFRLWLAKRYDNIENLNRRWGNVFWSMEYAAFDEIGLPVALPAQVNPIHALDFRRFASDEVCSFNRLQCDILREYSPGRDILHNFMGFFGEFNHHELSADLDVATWDNYPLGFTDMVRFIPEAERVQWMRSAHPDIAAFHHDLYRGMCKGRWWIMEQQSGPVNWASANPSPLPGMVRAWTWEAFAHGAEVVSYFRWRQVPYAQEQMHSGLHTSDGQIDQGGREAAIVAAEIDTLGDFGAHHAASVALVFDYNSKWMMDIQPHGEQFDYFGQVFAYYRALRRMGLDIDIVPPSADVSKYAMVVVPLLATLDDECVARWQASGAQIVMGPRTGSKTLDYALPTGLPPGPLRMALSIRVSRVESLRAGVSETVCLADGTPGYAKIWREFIDVAQGVEVLARFADGQPAVACQGAFSYHAAYFSDDVLDRLLADVAHAAGITIQALSGGLRLRRRGKLQFAVNYGPGLVSLPVAADRMVLGEAQLAPAGVAAWLAE